jgi:hypothetical protein
MNKELIQAPFRGRHFNFYRTQTEMLSCAETRHRTRASFWFCSRATVRLSLCRRSNGGRQTGGGCEGGFSCPPSSLFFRPKFFFVFLSLSQLVVEVGPFISLPRQPQQQQQQLRKKKERKKQHFFQRFSVYNFVRAVRS